MMVGCQVSGWLMTSAGGETPLSEGRGGHTDAEVRAWLALHIDTIKTVQTNTHQSAVIENYLRWGLER